MTPQFNYVLSNPPYQDSGAWAIFHKFQEVGNKIASKIAMIYPADKWMLRSGKGAGLAEFGLTQSNSRSLQQLHVYTHSERVFEGVDMQGGVSVVVHDYDTDNGGWLDVTTYDADLTPDQEWLQSPGDQTIALSNAMNRIVQKISNSADAQNGRLSELGYTVKAYGIGSSFIQNLGHTIPEGEYQGEADHVRVLANDKPGTAGRTRWFWVPRTALPHVPELFTQYVAVLSTRYTAGYPGRSQQARVFAPGEAFGESRFAVAAFDTREEAENFLAWLGTDVVRVLLLSSSRRIKNFGVNVPLLNSYHAADSVIDFTQDVNTQLIERYGLTDADMDYIRETVAMMGPFHMDESNLT